MDLVNAWSNKACNNNVLNWALTFDIFVRRMTWNYDTILSHQMLNFVLLVWVGKRESASWKGRKSGSRKMFQVKKNLYESQLISLYLKNRLIVNSNNQLWNVTIEIFLFKKGKDICFVKNTLTFSILKAGFISRFTCKNVRLFLYRI